MTTKLSVCVIAGSDRAALSQCMTSLSGIPDEVVAIDAGLTSETRQMLTDAGVAVISGPTGSDRADAQNAVLRHVSGDWVLFIHSHETIDRAVSDSLPVFLVDIAEPISYRIAVVNAPSGGAVVPVFVTRLCNRPRAHFFAPGQPEHLMGSVPVQLDPQAMRLLRNAGAPPLATAASGWVGALEELVGSKQREVVLAHAHTLLEGDFPDEPVPDVVKELAALRRLEVLHSIQSWSQVEEHAAALVSQMPALGDDAVYLFFLGECRRATGKAEEALAMLQRAAERVASGPARAPWTDAVPPAVAGGLAALYLDGSRMDEAGSVLDLALSNGQTPVKQRAKLHAMRAKVYAARGEVEAAWAQAESSLHGDPSQRTVIANGFLTYNQPVLAMRLMAPVLDDTAILDRTMTLANSLIGSTQGVDVLNWYLESHPRDTSMRRLLGVHLLAIGEPLLARKSIADSLGTSMDDVSVYLHLAHFAEGLSQFDGAEALLRDVVEQATHAERPDIVAEATLQWANLAFRRQEYGKAHDLFEAVRELTPDNAYVHFALGSIQIALGDIGKAIRFLEAALLRDPGHAEAQRLLSQLKSPYAR